MTVVPHLTRPWCPTWHYICIHCVTTFVSHLTRPWCPPWLDLRVPLDSTFVSHLTLCPIRPWYHTDISFTRPWCPPWLDLGVPLDLVSHITLVSHRHILYTTLVSPLTRPWCPTWPCVPYNLGITPTYPLHDLGVPLDSTLYHLTLCPIQPWYHIDISFTRPWFPRTTLTPLRSCSSWAWPTSRSEKYSTSPWTCVSRRRPTTLTTPSLLRSSASVTDATRSDFAPHLCIYVHFVLLHSSHLYNHLLPYCWYNLYKTVAMFTLCCSVRQMLFSSIRLGYGRIPSSFFLCLPALPRPRFPCILALYTHITMCSPSRLITRP